MGGKYKVKLWSEEERKFIVKDNFSVGKEDEAMEISVKYINILDEKKKFSI